MPEIRLKSQQKEPYASEAELSQPRAPDKPSPGKATHQSAMIEETGAALRRQALAHLTAIQINTAGLSGPYRSAAETMEHVCGSHSAVRAVRIVLRRSLLIPRTGPLCRALVAWTLEACGGKHARAARSLGMTVRQLRRVLDSQRSRLTSSQTLLSLVE